MASLCVTQARGGLIGAHPNVESNPLETSQNPAPPSWPLCKPPKLPGNDCFFFLSITLPAALQRRAAVIDSNLARFMLSPFPPAGIALCSNLSRRRAPGIPLNSADSTALKKYRLVYLTRLQSLSPDSYCRFVSDGWADRLSIQATESGVPEMEKISHEEKNAHRATMRPQLALPFEGGNAKVGAAAESRVSAGARTLPAPATTRLLCLVVCPAGVAGFSFQQGA